MREKNVQNMCVKKVSKICVWKLFTMCMRKIVPHVEWKPCARTCVKNVWKTCPGIAFKNLSKTQHFCMTFLHTFFIRFSNLFSRARAFYNFTFARKFSHHMLDISMHTYVLDLFFTRTFWTLFHTCILDMFSHPYFWPPCPIPSPSRGDLGLICSVEAFLVHLQTVALLKNPG